MIQIAIRLMISSTLKVTLEFSHILLLGVVGYSVSALNRKPEPLTVALCLCAVAVVVTVLQSARSLNGIKLLRQERIRNQLLEYFTPTETDLRITLSYLAVVLVGGTSVMLLVGAWEGLLLTFVGGGLAWFSGKLFQRLARRETRKEFEAARRKLKPFRNMAVDAIPLATFIVGIALFPHLLTVRSILIYLVLRHATRHLFQLSVRSGHPAAD